ncbi:MAG TPA: YmaF family protein [Bacillota bacterium]|nr:YmaF family protein [Bacillota bacterium]HPW41045.1 YmaF family protein [Bacillota bacterium]
MIMGGDKMCYGFHSHSFKGETTFNFGHDHGYSGNTTYNYDTPGHIHYASGITTYDNRHSHYYCFMTGPEIEVNGGHIHYYEAIAQLSNGHIHYIYGYTSL